MKESKEYTTKMLGVVCGDIAGSKYEHNNIKYELEEVELITDGCRFTDDTVMSCAVAEGIKNALEKLPKNWMKSGRIIDLMYHVMVQFRRQ